MTEQQVTPKKPIELDWSRGETDGEIRRGFFYELKNVELHEEGVLKSRDCLSLQYDFSNVTKLRYINSDPSNDHSDGWFVGLTDIRISIFPAELGGFLDPDATHFVWPISNVDPDKCEIAIHSTTVYIATKDSDGEPLGIIQIVYQNERDSFRPPSYVEESDAEYAGITISAGWYMIDISSSKPKLRLGYVKGFGQMRILRQTVTNGVMSYLDYAPNEEYGVGVIVEPVLDSSGKYGENTTVEYVSQFIFSNGSVSLPSDPMRVEINYDEDKHDNLWDDTLNRYTMSTQIMVSDQIHPMIKGIRLFRRVVITDFEGNSDNSYSTPSHELVSVAWLDDSDLSQFDEDYGYGFSDPDDQVFVVDADYEDERPKIGSGTQWLTYDGGHRLFHLMTTNVEKTSGWIKLGGSICAFQVEHLFREGVCTFKFGSSSNIFMSYMATSVEILRKIGNIDAPCRILGSAYSPVIVAMLAGPLMMKGPHQEDSSPYGINNWDMDYLHLRGMYKVYAPGTPYAEYNGDEADSYNFIATATVGGNGALAFFSDNLDPALQSLQQEAADLEQIADVKPRYIGVAGGRLFALNVIKDGINMPSLMMYSEFARPGIFLKSNTIPYGSKDDGEGVAISSSRSYVFAHHSSATYILDISGGYDFAWRELGSYSGVDCLKQDAIGMTPAGPMWAGANYVYWHNGNMVVPVSKEIKDRYKSITDSITHLHFKEDLRQLWVCYGQGVRVLDIDTGSWHYHYFDELGSNANIVDMMLIGTDQYVVVENSNNHYIYKFVDAILQPYEWSVDSGWTDYGMPKYIKKVKRIYFEVNIEDEYGTKSSVFMTTEGNVSGDIENLHYLDESGMIRLSASVRGYKLRHTLTIKAGNYWKGKIQSLGLSFKLKRLK